MCSQFVFKDFTSEDSKPHHKSEESQFSLGIVFGANDSKDNQDFKSGLFVRFCEEDSGSGTKSFFESRSSESSTKEEKVENNHLSKKKEKLSSDEPSADLIKHHEAELQRVKDECHIKISKILKSIKSDITRLVVERNQDMLLSCDSVASLILAVAKKLALMNISDDSRLVDRLLSRLREVVVSLKREDKVVICVNPKLETCLSDGLGDCENVVVMAKDSMNVADYTVEWSSGSVRSVLEDRLREIQQDFSV